MGTRTRTPVRLLDVTYGDRDRTFLYGYLEKETESSAGGIWASVSALNGAGSNWDPDHKDDSKVWADLEFYGKRRMN